MLIDHLVTEVPEDFGPDPFFGEYGTNMYIPGIREWARDMRLPWWVVEMRNSVFNPQ